MSEVAGAGGREDVDLMDILRQVYAGKWWILGFSALGLMIAITYCHLVTPVFRTEMSVAPAASSSGGMNRSGLGGLAAIAGISLGGGPQGITPFEMYLETLRSRALAMELAEDQRIMQSAIRAHWDERAGGWREPDSAGHVVKRWIKGALGFPGRAWQVPGAADLEEFLLKNVSVESADADEPQVSRLFIHHVDPTFSEYLLLRMNSIANERVRKADLEAARSYAAYLTEKLQAEKTSELRRNLSEALVEQEKSIMLASSSAPYAARLLEAPATRRKPVEPNAVLALLAGLLGGAVLGTGIVLVEPRSVWHALRQKPAR